MASSTCSGLIKGCAARFAALEPNGVPDPGSGNVFTIADFVRVAYTEVVREGDDIQVTNACGSNCIDFQEDPTMRRYDVEIELCTHNPELFVLIAGGKLLTDTGVITPGGTLVDAQGYAVPAVGATLGAPNGVSLEVWARRIIDGNPDPDFPYHRFVFPKVRSIRQTGTRTFENGAHAFVFTGQALENPNWFDGPYNDWDVDSDRILQDLPVTSLPATSCTSGTISVS